MVLYAAFFHWGTHVMNESMTTARAAREKEAYNHGLQRDLYRRILAHCRFCYLQKRQSILEEVMKPAHGARVLELGSSSWYRWLEETGVTPRELTCINIAEVELEKGIERSSTSRLRPVFKIMDAQALEFPDSSIDFVFGSAILHHLDLERALAEIKRVLVPGGHMVFTEPLDNNPVGRVVRALTPAARTVDERPFRFTDLKQIKRHFANARFFHEQFLSVPAGVISGFLFQQPDNFLTRAAFTLDEQILQWIPALGSYYRKVLVVAEKAG